MILDAYSNQLDVLKSLKANNGIVPHEMISALKEEIERIKANSEKLKNKLKSQDQMVTESKKKIEEFK